MSNPILQGFSNLSNEIQDFLHFIEHNTCNLIFSTILVTRYPCQNLVKIEIFWTDFQNFEIPNITKISPVGAELSHEDEQTYIQTRRVSVFVILGKLLNIIAQLQFCIFLHVSEG